MKGLAKMNLVLTRDVSGPLDRKALFRRNEAVFVRTMLQMVEKLKREKFGYLCNYMYGNDWRLIRVVS